MRYFFLVCAGMADEPLEALGGRTPLEVAKTPFMDELARAGSLSSAAWLTAPLPASDEVAAYSTLGYDPKTFYTGPAPLEALGAGLSQNDSQVAFRCDFVTVSDGELVDPTAGRISAKEAQVLVRELNRRLETFRAKIVPLEGHRNLLFVDDAEKVEALDDAECLAPVRVRAQKVAKALPKGKAGAFLQDVMEATREVLENHDVNRVRIDLGENPASQVWLWGQGRRPKLRPFKELAGVEGAFLADRLGWAGLALGAGLRPMKRWDENEFADFNWIESSGRATESSKDYKGKIRRIEEFDVNTVGRLVSWLKNKKTPARVAVTSDVVQSTSRGERTHSHAPLLFWGEGVASSGAESFSEKSCGLSGKVFDPGHTYLPHFLKG